MYIATWSNKLCDMIKQNESKLQINTDFKIQPNKVDNLFVSYCFYNPSTARIFRTKWPISMGSVTKGIALQTMYTINQRNENWIWPTSSSFCLIASRIGLEKQFIHSNLISCSLIGSLVNTRSVLKMSTALCVLHQDCAQTARGAFGAWSRPRTSHRLIHFFHWVNLLIFFMFSGILKPFYL